MRGRSCDRREGASCGQRSARHDTEQELGEREYGDRPLLNNPCPRSDGGYLQRRGMTRANWSIRTSVGDARNRAVPFRYPSALPETFF